MEAKFEYTQNLKKILIPEQKNCRAITAEKISQRQGTNISRHRPMQNSFAGRILRECARPEKLIRIR